MQKSYDYIIVGGGTAGCVLANRLSADPKTKVLLLEAGGDDRNILFKLPAGFAKMTKGIASWGYSTVPQKHMRDRVFWYTQAKVIGGGSSINAQIYTRGHRYDYDTWAQSGCTGWNYDSVVKYFRRSEDNDSFDNETHGKGGPVGVSKPIAVGPITEAVIRAAEQFGIPYNPDLAGPDHAGFGYYQLTQRDAKRSSAASGFLRPVQARANLDIKLGATTKRIIVKKSRATGVEVFINGQTHVVNADAEVIVCSGAIGSPKLLMLSGIGPADHLRSVGISPVHELAGVGQNLQDHLDICVIAECSGDHTYDKYGKPWWSLVAGLQYLLTKRGPAASSLFETGGFWYADRHAPAPDIQFHFGQGSGIEAGIAKLKNSGATMNSAPMRPNSRGSVKLSSHDFDAHPLIDPNFWADPRDRDLSLKGLQMARDIMRQEALQKYILAERLPGPDVSSEEDLITYACKMAKTDHHPVGTCAMGNGSRHVVSPTLSVHGLTGLRVADSSIMPNVISSNTNAATMMIAEKAADMILLNR